MNSMYKFSVIKVQAAQTLIFKKVIDIEYTNIKIYLHNINFSVFLSYLFYIICS